ncbi:MAG TPA: HAMP domain-containing sensor histidine kinase [Cellulomonas sp.]
MSGATPERTWPSPDQPGTWQADAAPGPTPRPAPGDPAADAPDLAAAPDLAQPADPAEVPAGHGPARTPGGLLLRIHRLWERTPLLARLVGITAVLLATGLAVAGAATTTLLSSYLLTQVDEALTAQTQSVGDDIVKVYNQSGSLSLLSGESNLRLNDFALEASIAGSVGSVPPSTATTEEYGEPDLPDLTLDTVTDYATDLHTVSSSVGGASWRVAVSPVKSGETVVGWVIVAQPLGEMQSIVRQAALLLWSSAVAILVIGVLVGIWAVRRSLRPLREIEDVAATIAAGDLSRRVPEAPQSTEVGRLGSALNSMLTQIESAFDARAASEERMRQFVADASHELRTPLAAIRGYGELYRMGALTEKEQVDDTLRRIEQSATRMGGLVEDLLALARLDAGRPARTEPVDLAVLATDAAHDLRALDPSRQVRVGPLPGARPAAPATTDTEVDPLFGPTVVQGDESRLRQVLANLIGNVYRHTPVGSPVEIEVGRLGDEVVVQVRDHGPGIAPEHVHRVFERFYRVDASRTRDGSGAGGGAGLGMAIVAAIIEAHRGRVEIVATEGGGATIRVHLPVDGAGTATGDGDHPAQ